MKGFKKEFLIFKEGFTDKKVAILSGSEPFDKQQKISFYLGLGYKVYTTKGKEINQ